MSRPKYFFAMFGDPNPPEKDTVESGIYHPDPKHAPFATRPGDVLLLYCTENYSRHPKQAPGIGVVLDTDQKKVTYRYLPLTQSVSKTMIEEKFQAKDGTKFKNRRFTGFWLFEISRESFIDVLGDQMIAWP